MAKKQFLKLERKSKPKKVEQVSCLTLGSLDRAHEDAQAPDTADEYLAGRYFVLPDRKQLYAES